MARLEDSSESGDSNITKFLFIMKRLFAAIYPPNSDYASRCCSRQGQSEEAVGRTPTKALDDRDYQNSLFHFLTSKSLCE
jgi:hypothetical protein